VLREKDQALFWLEKACAEKSDDVEWIKVNRSAESLRSEPRYAPLLKKMGLGQLLQVFGQGPTGTHRSKWVVQRAFPATPASTCVATKGVR
jgi:hypothetical protein